LQEICLFFLQGLVLWHVREDASHAMNVTSSQFPLAVFPAVNRRNTHQWRRTVFVDDMQSIWFDCLPLHLAGHQLGLCWQCVSHPSGCLSGSALNSRLELHKTEIRDFTVSIQRRENRKTCGCEKRLLLYFFFFFFRRRDDEEILCEIKGLMGNSYYLDQGFPKYGARTPELSLGGAREEKCNGGLMV